MGQPIVSLRGIRKAYQDHLVVDGLTLDIQQGEFLTLLGPSGCGKTTILRMIAGLETCDEGDLIINGSRSNHIPASKRDVNTVFQSYALFPHMNVFDNIAFGLKIRKNEPADIQERVAQALSMVKLSGLEQRNIQQLSGGQRQRVAIARAIINRPLILLLDEPLSALDHKLRKEMRLELKHLHRQLGITFVFVTHDQEEALVMSDRIVVMNNGKIEQTGTPRQIYEEPATLFVAEFIGETNFLDGRVTSAGQGKMDILVQDMAMTVDNPKGFEPGQKVKILLRPEDLKIERVSQGCTPPYFPGRVKELIYKGTTVDLIIELASGKTLLATEFFNEDDEDLFYAHNEEVCVSWIEGWEVVLPHG